MKIKICSELKEQLYSNLIELENTGISFDLYCDNPFVEFDEIFTQSVFFYEHKKMWAHKYYFFELILKYKQDEN